MLSQNFKYSLIALVLLVCFWAPTQSWLLVDELNLEWSVAIIDSVVTSLFLSLETFLIFNTLTFYQPEKKRMPLLILGIIAMNYGMMVGAESVLINVVDLVSTSYFQNFSLQRIIFSTLISFSVLIVAWFSTAKKNTSEEEERRQNTEKLARNAELASLRQQLQPHFLFNSLNSINALIGTQPEKARKMVQQLSDFLRGTIKKDDSQLVTLFDEMYQLKLYLDIEKVRFGHRLVANIDNENGSLEAKLPPLLIQPVVENAIKFGLYDTVGETVIQVKTRMDQKHLVIQVENPFDMATASPRHGTGFGLSSLQRRLYLLYARNDLLTTSQQENVFITQIKIPQV